ncbi:ras association domain-containing protein 2-like isoform X2, partial [Biomphalaria pfeifferi]
ERKTSLGKEWHPSCLKCVECGKVLSPGQHAEHKGLPYCHNPCYKALFGPSILGYGSNISSPANFARKDRPASYGHDYGDGNGFNEIYSVQNIQSAKGGHNNEVNIMHSNQTHKGGSRQSANNKTKPDSKIREILQKIEEFNKYNEGKVHHQMQTLERDDGSIHVEGPLRIYWGLSQPIQLIHCDNIPPAPIAQWRHSLYEVPGSPDTPDKRLSNTLNLKAPSSPPGKTRELDDMFSPSSPDDVVRRKKVGVRKFKTVAYRGDQPTKWKRASINGHIFNYDTSVFTPVLGSCTTVSVDSSLTTAEVIETLLDKFKVQNNPNEYVLSIVSEDGERLLTNTDKPLLERLKLGPHETMGKIFIRERTLENGAGKVNSTIKKPIVETAEENLPHEVEQLLVLPEAVLTGLLRKFKNDEEKEVQVIKTRYDIARRKIQRILNEKQMLQTSSSA